MRAQYERSGGKGAFLENYIRKVLILQEAKTKGFDQKPSVRSEMQAASDSALFDRYVRDVVANNIVTEAAMKAYYDAHLDQFKVPEMIKVRHIVIGVDSGPHPHTKAQALEIAKKALTDVITMIPRTDNPAATAHEHAATFGKLARAYSEDPAGPNGGDLGWVTREQLDPDELRRRQRNGQPGLPEEHQ